MDADSHCKSVVNGAYGVWMLQNSYELAKAMETADKSTTRFRIINILVLDISHGIISPIMM